MSLTLSSILRKRNRDLFNKYDATQDELSGTYSELLTVVVEITTTYHKRIRSKIYLNHEEKGQSNIMQEVRLPTLKISISSLGRGSTLFSIVVIKFPTPCGHASLSTRRTPRV